jgi:hypothetical protein
LKGKVTIYNLMHQQGRKSNPKVGSLNASAVKMKERWKGRIIDGKERGCKIDIGKGERVF